MPSGVVELDFGAFPGASDAFVDVPGQAGFVSTSRREAYIEPKDTADHSTDEHMVETLKVCATYVTDGTLRIHGFNTSQLHEPLDKGRPANPLMQVNATRVATDPVPYRGGCGTRIYGRWSTGYVWANS